MHEPRHLETTSDTCRELPALATSARALPDFLEAARDRLQFLAMMLSDPARVTQARLDLYSSSVAQYNELVAEYNAPVGRRASKSKPKSKPKAKKLGRRDHRRRR